MLRRVLAHLAVLAGATALVIVPLSPAQAAECEVVDKFTQTCKTAIIAPPKPGTEPVVAGPGGGSAPVAAVCFADTASVEVPCSNGSGVWSNASDCYYALAAVQGEPPAGTDPALGGAYYTCMPYCVGQAGTTGCWVSTQWFDNPPAGIDTLTPAQAAAQLVDTFPLTGIDIGFAPDPDLPESRGHTGIPVWMWVENPTPETWGPFEQTSTLGGVTVTATAQVTGVVWNMGDGTNVGCGSLSTSYEVSYGVVDSPTCGHRYARVSASQPGGRYPVTATSQWEVRWVGGGQDGTINVTTTSDLTLEVRDLQALNVG